MESVGSVCFPKSKVRSLLSPPHSPGASRPTIPLQLLCGLLLLQLLVLLLVRKAPPCLPWLWNYQAAPSLSQIERPLEICSGPRIFIYDLPPEFNVELVGNCSTINPWRSVCPALSNAGLGPRVDGVGLAASNSWYNTDQFTTEVIFHSRLRRHPCITDDPELATAFYIPFYAGLDICRYIFLPSSSAQQRDRLSKQLLDWLNGQYYWRRHGGWDHFLMIGRITWDFRRTREADWGSSFIYMPGMKNVTRLLIERNPWDEQEVAVPYPTSFHPTSDREVALWQDQVKKSKRSLLFSFAGAPRQAYPNDFRATLMDQCLESGSCKSLNCSGKLCDTPQAVMELFLGSTFCLQPRGDSFTRKSTFDALLAGCIPVFFWNQSAYWQYKWHLPAEEASYSVFIPKNAVRSGLKIKDVLMAIPEEQVKRMRGTIIRLIPNIVYAFSGNSFRKNKDAFDIAIDRVLRRVSILKLNLRTPNLN
ncbi:hypothetical protein O6H91_Y202500 [Diphasiastrum complanatum]|nr:hypothetical protein O6H91_Y202500 [Diphasiastrum complanatum]